MPLNTYIINPKTREISINFKVGDKYGEVSNCTDYEITGLENKIVYYKITDHMNREVFDETCSHSDFVKMILSGHIAKIHEG